MAEIREIVEDFNQNMRTIKATMTSKHKQERKNFVTRFAKSRARKYSSTAVLTEEVYFAEPLPGVDC